MPVVEIKGVGKAQFPDNMNINDIRTFLRNKYYQDEAQGISRALDPAPQSVAPYNPSLAEKIGSGIASTLKDTGIISDNYGAQRIGKNISALAEFLPGVGDATAGDEFGRALSEGDKFGMAMAGLGVIPVAGDALKGVRAKRIKHMYRDKGTFLNKDNTLSDNYSEAKDSFSDTVSDIEWDELENSSWENAVAVDLSASDRERVIGEINKTELYHGSPDTEIKGLSRKSKGGLFLTHNKDVADHYSEGGKTYKQKVSIKNPLFVESTDYTADMEGSGVFDELIGKGYDSIVPLDKGDVVILDDKAIR